MSHFFISAAHKSSGKTTLSIGLSAALRDRGLAVQPFKKGPDYIDPLWLSATCNRPCLNLDFFTMQRQEIEQGFSASMATADIGVIEGNKGLYDGLDLHGSNSNAALANLLGSPVILVIDARGMTRGIAPLILGYQAFDQDLNIAGVILNKVGGSRHEAKLCNVIEHYTDVPVVGAVHSNPDLVIEERHLGLMPSNEADRAKRKIDMLGAAVASQVDLQRVLDIAATATPAITLDTETVVHTNQEPPVRIGYARDRAFGFYYPGDLQALRDGGAELLPIDTLHDPALPQLDGIFLGGGFPEMVMEQLEANASLRADLLGYIESGGPVYAECGGLMYLARTMTWKGKTFSMVGALPGDVVMHERPQGRGYVRLRETGNGPWPAEAEGPIEIAAHEFHYSALENLDCDLEYAYEVLRGTGIDGSHDGIVYKNMLANYTHIRDVAGNHWTKRFLAHVRSVKEGQATV
ncbi:MAG: hydrogenobyrinic acid a,c-diamide synthase (glutamine-hydrolyzing) [Gammaproteobacteria bacterium]|nr:hydrogenobyrinic acid a,c-diamide synthase (glutamine-hydrolyzing) [Gammaproteobacteria bacterium]